VTVLVFLLFAVVAGNSGMFSAEGIVNWGTVAAFLGLIAVGAALLMIGGEFDLSVGSMIGFAGMMLTIPALYWGWPLWLSCLFAFALALVLTASNAALAQSSLFSTSPSTGLIAPGTGGPAPAPRRLAARCRG